MESIAPLVDVGSPLEYRGELLHKPDYPQEGAMRGGHIQAAVNIPWSEAINSDDSTFISPEDLHELNESKLIILDKQIIAYCRIGERSSYTWFGYKHLCGFPYVKNFDGLWVEWGNLVNAPIEY